MAILRWGRSGSGGAAGARAGAARAALGVEDVEEELLIEMGELLARGVCEELAGEVGEHAVVAHGVVGERSPVAAYSAIRRASSGAIASPVLGGAGAGAAGAGTESKARRPRSALRVLSRG